MNRLAIYGGRFDPVHIGHLIHARLTKEEFELDEVMFIPAARPPHKDTVASFEDRVEMVRLAISDEDNFSLSLIEQERGLSYTVDTLQELSDSYPGAELFLIMGADEYLSMPTAWKDPDKITGLADLIVLPRRGAEIEAKTEGVLFPHFPMIQISSSVIRRRVRMGKSIRHWVPDVVFEFIETRKLYKEDS